MGNKALDYTALTIAIIGAVNWGLVGFFNFNLVSFISAACPGFPELYMRWSESADYTCSPFMVAQK